MASFNDPHPEWKDSAIFVLGQLLLTWPLNSTVANKGQTLCNSWNDVHIDKCASYLEKLHIQISKANATAEHTSKETNAL